MKTRRYKVNLIFSLLVAFGGLGAILGTGQTPKLGLDLEGGISVILTAEGEVTEANLNKTVEIIRQRIDEFGAAEAEVSVAGSENILVQMPGVENETKALELIGTTAQLTFRQVEEVFPPGTPEDDLPEVTEEKGPEVNQEEVVYPSNEDDAEGTLYRLKAADLTGDIITKAEAVPADAQGITWGTSIEMNDEGAQEWASLTSKLACLRDEGEQIKSQIAIVLDGRVESAAGMQDPATNPDGGVECDKGIEDGKTFIEADSEQTAKDLALVLRYGSLPLTLTQSEVSKVSPTLGRDSLDAGLKAGILGLALVMIYMVLYYRALGFVVWLGLAVFTATLYTTVTLLSQGGGLTLSLAGIAGIIISVGVTADSYIVAFERLKDEVHSGKTVRAAVERGMTRAFRTILVADFVTGAAAIILFFLAIGPVRGFALTLGLATIIDVFVAYFFTRSAVQLLSRRKAFSGEGFFGLRRALGAKS